MDTDVEVRARIAADIEAPDKVFYQLTARQVAVLSAGAAAGYLVFRTTSRLLPLPLVLALVCPVIGAAIAVAVARRDGLPMDAWLWAALRFRRAPARAAAACQSLARVPQWAPATTGAQPAPSVLRLPATAIADNGVIDLGDGAATALVAATTINVGLRTAAEQAAAAGAYARWLNSLTGPVQIVVSAQRVDLTGHAQRVADGAQTLPHPALADAAVDYAQFLLEVSQQRDPLWRTVTIACTASGDRGSAGEALRRAEHTAGALAALGCQTRVLDGQTATAVLTAATDPYQYGDASWARALPQHPVRAVSPFEQVER
ncbi:PrgI family protein [Rugosimonospora africana]|uniref:PrgI family protein n=1 Tax=Rugosimonospora africana TaxID=556532 RepID=UPI0019446BAA|nr:PrgI family protein [Rugosimonospora africana]